MISLTLLLPALTAFLLLLMPRERTRAMRYTALFGSLATLGFALAILLHVAGAGYGAGGEGFALVEEHAWVPSLGISYKVGIDGISLFLVVLTAFLGPVCVLCSWRSVDRRVREFHVALLLLEASMLGVFVALDLVLFYVFWEVMLVPMILLIGIWGSGRRIYAAVKFLLYTLAGSLLMFLAILYLYFHVAGTGTGSFDLGQIYRALREHPLDPVPQLLCFLAFALSFSIKVPLVPFHTWLPDAHTEAPTAGSVILAGVLLKMGTYGFLRLAIPFFPSAAAELSPWISALAVAGIIFGALMCFVQDDIKRLIAYSSVSHLGFVVLGLFAFRAGQGYTARGVTGGILQMLNHGLSTGALFLLVGVLYERRHTREISEYGGLAAVTPRLGAVFLIVTLSSIGLPFLNGFVGEFLILQGTFERSILLAALGGTGVVLGAIYMLRLYARVFLGRVRNAENRDLPDLDGRELGYFVALIVPMVLIGMRSTWFTELITPSVTAWLDLAAP